MNNDPRGPKDPKEKKDQPGDLRNREGRDESLEESSPTDSRSDEKVIVNEQRGNKTVNAPSQTAPNVTEGGEEIIN